MSSGPRIADMADESDKTLERTVEQAIALLSSISGSGNTSGASSSSLSRFEGTVI